MLKGISKAKTPIVFKSGVVPISVICVAATFTSLSYANNGGKVQLSSDGVHGLTTSPAVGASVYVSWDGGTGVSGLYNVNSVDDANKITIEYPYAAYLGTPTVAVAGTTIAVKKIALPSLVANSQIRIAALSTFTGSATEKNIIVYLNDSVSTQCKSFTAIASNTALRMDNAYVVIKDSSAYFCTFLTAPNSGSNNSIFSGTLTTYTANTLNIALRITTANEKTILQNYFVEVFI